MKIVMLGGSAVGKTTVMVSSYGMMAPNVFQGFHIHSRSEQVHDRLMKAYRAFQSRGFYPDGTTRMEEYEYDFSVNKTKCMSFTLVDIRGESIKDYDNQALLNELSESDAVMLFFNGGDVLNHSDLEDDIFDLLSLLNTGFGMASKNRLLMPVITQMDRFLPITEETVDKLLAFTAPLKKMTEKNESISYQLVPTACSRECMMDLDFLMVYLMLFGYNQDIKKVYEALTEEVEELKKEYNEHPIINILLDSVGLSARRDAVRRRIKELEPIIDFHDNTMIPIRDKMIKFIDDYELFSYITLSRRGSSATNGGGIWELT